MPLGPLSLPYPAQGHVIPLLELSLCLAKYGFKITFVNTEYNHKRVVSALAETNHIGDGRVHLVSLPDGLEPGEDRNNLGKLTETMLQVMPVKLEELINTINGLGGNEITGVIADENLGWALEVAAKMKIPRVAFWPAAAALLAMQFSIPNLIEQKIIDSDGKKGFNCFLIGVDECIQQVFLSSTRPCDPPARILAVLVSITDDMEPVLLLMRVLGGLWKLL